MENQTILETHRLVLRKFDLNDAEFILQLVNSPNWLKFIGDKKIKTIKGAETYLKNGPLKSYIDNGYGLWLIQLKGTNTPIGMCGLVNRDTLDDVDIGFAMLPNYYKMGYGFEIATATLSYVKNTLNIANVLAITNAQNLASIRLLNKIGLVFKKTIKLSKTDEVLLFSPSNTPKDQIEIDQLTTCFYSLFTNTSGQTPNVHQIKKMVIPDGVIINNTNEQPEIYTLDSFITPREKILTDGTLTEFSEREISHQTEIFESIAHRLSVYEKSGYLNGILFSAKGVKSIQFIKVSGVWKISAIAWNDEK